MTVRDWYEFVETDLENYEREKFREMLSDIGFDDLYVERTDDHGICYLCERDGVLYLVMNRGQLRETNAYYLCSTCTNEMKRKTEE